MRRFLHALITFVPVLVGCGTRCGAGTVLKDGTCVGTEDTGDAGGGETGTDAGGESDSGEADSDTAGESDSDDSGGDSEAHSGEESGTDSGSDSGDTGEPCEPVGVGESAVAWDLPPGFPTYSFDWTSDTSDGTLNWTLLDLPGDGGVDLVLTRHDDAGIAGLGDTQWLVYDNTGAGFDGSPWSWSLPAGFPTLTFDESVDSSDGTLNWSLLDLGGDGATDLVVARWDDASVAGLGTTRWLVYENDGTGFDSSATAWALPPDFPALTFDETTGIAGSTLNWTLLDLAGDGLADLVVTRWDDAGIAGLGDTRWIVYENTGTGFSTTATAWTLPSGFPSMTFGNSADTSSSTLNWSLLDLDGDERLDLVVSRWDDAGIAGLGDTKWLLYDNTGTGFSASPAAWTIPSGFPSMTFGTTVDGSASTLNWVLADLPGDGGVDLVVTRWDDASIAGLGDTRWLVYDNDGTGFAASAWAWSMPSGFPSLTFGTTTDPSDSTLNWALGSLDDALVDVIVTRWDDAGIADLGTERWIVYGGTCGG